MIHTEYRSYMPLQSLNKPRRYHFLNIQRSARRQNRGEGQKVTRNNERFRRVFVYPRSESCDGLLGCSEHSEANGRRTLERF